MVPYNLCLFSTREVPASTHSVKEHSCSGLFQHLSMYESQSTKDFEVDVVLLASVVMAAIAVAPVDRITRGTNTKRIEQLCAKSKGEIKRTKTERNLFFRLSLMVSNNY